MWQDHLLIHILNFHARMPHQMHFRRGSLFVRRGSLNQPFRNDLYQGFSTVAVGPCGSHGAVLRGTRAEAFTK